MTISGIRNLILSLTQAALAPLSAISTRKLDIESILRMVRCGEFVKIRTPCQIMFYSSDFIEQPSVLASFRSVEDPAAEISSTLVSIGVSAIRNMMIGGAVHLRNGNRKPFDYG